MKRFWLVGGVLRDLLLFHWGRLPKLQGDYDLVVEGASPEEMTHRYGPPVGAGFSVWRAGKLDLALPRFEWKTGVGYKGFSWRLGAPLLEELRRRDFSVNSLAYPVMECTELPEPQALEHAVEETIRNFDPQKVYDPFGGMEDLRAGLLRAAYPEAFKEDPVRVLRAARFAARYGWEVERTTLQAARFAARELPHEPPERVWLEWEKATAHSPSRFLEVLLETRAVKYVRGLEWLGLPTPQKNHPEDLATHTVMSLRAAEKLGLPLGLPGFTALLFHDRGKVLEGLPHDGQEAEVLVRSDLEALRAPKAVVRVATTWLCHHMAFWGVSRPGRVLELAEALEKAGISPRLAGALALADSQGRVNPKPLQEVLPRLEERVRLLETTLEVMRIIRGNHPKVQALPGPERSRALRELRAFELSRRVEKGRREWR